MAKNANGLEFYMWATTAPSVALQPTSYNQQEALREKKGPAPGWATQAARIKKWLQKKKEMTLRSTRGTTEMLSNFYFLLFIVVLPKEAGGPMRCEKCGGMYDEG
jgi:hypothetical protein